MPGGGGGGGGKQSSFPWAGQWPYLTDIYARGKNLSTDPFEYFPGSTVAPRGPGETEATQMALARGATGNPALDAAQAMLQRTAEGQYLTPESNPALADYYGAAARGVTQAYQRSVLPSLEARFGGAGRVDSPGYMAAHGRAQGELGRSLSDLAASIYAPAYESERGRQISAAQLAPAFAAEDWRDVGQLRATGLAEREYGQQVLSDEIARFNFGQEEPWNRLERYRGLIGDPIILNKGTSGGGQSGAQTAISGVSSLASLGILAYALGAFSTKQAKHELGELDFDVLIQAAAKLPVKRWAYKAVTQVMEEPDPHVGPYAEDFRELFGLGDGKTIPYVDALGVLFAVVGELARRELARREVPA